MEPPAKRGKIDDNVDYSTDIMGSSEMNSSDVCDIDSDTVKRRSYHQDRYLPSLDERERQNMDVVSMTEDSDRDRHQNHNVRIVESDYNNDSYDEEFAITEG